MLPSIDLPGALDYEYLPKKIRLGLQSIKLFIPDGIPPGNGNCLGFVK